MSMEVIIIYNSNSMEIIIVNKKVFTYHVFIKLID